MNNAASILVLVFLAITFLQSGYDKLFFWKDNLNWLKGHFSKTPIKNVVPLALFNILVFNIVIGHTCDVVDVANVRYSSLFELLYFSSCIA